MPSPQGAVRDTAIMERRLARILISAGLRDSGRLSSSGMRPILRLLLVLVTVLALAPLAPTARAADEPEIDIRQCICAPGMGACQHYLRTPKKAHTDPCWCHKCREFSQHDGASLPKGWSQACFKNKKEGPYLKRHAAAWGIICSDCIQDEKSCKVAIDKCAACAYSSSGTKDYKGRDARRTVMKRLGTEERFFKKPKNVRVLYNANFYLVTDVVSIKVATSPTTKRKASGHEWAHMMMERAEYARREFTDHFGDSLDIDKPTGMYIPVDRRDGNSLARTYLGNATANILYGGSDRSSVGGGFCFHGFVISMEHFGDGGDPAIHFAMRHMIGHELMSCWVVVDGHNRALPRWLHVGAAHWLSRLQPRFREDAFACHLEGKEMQLSGEDWDKELRRIARKSKPGAVEKMLVKNAQGQLTEADHRRSWSYMDLCLSEWRAPWVAMLTALRKRSKSRDAFVENLEVTPEIFDERWRERVTGKRPSMDPLKSDTEGTTNEDLTSRERESLRRERDPETLAALVRGLGTVTDPATAELLIDLFEQNNALVRETIMVSLLAIEAPDVLTTAWQRGLGHKNPMARAYSARLCGLRGVAEAIPALRKQLTDKNWYARAESAVALGTLGDVESFTAIVKLLGDAADKTKVAAMDALAMLGGHSEPAVGAIAKYLSAPRWQLRVTATEALAGIGSMEAVEPLISRMEIESGRLRRDIQTALETITRDDLGKNPAHWRTWWEKEKAASGGKLPGRPDAPATGTPEEEPESRYAEAEYFGIELFGSRVAFVLDTSGSMELRFIPATSDAKRRGRRLRGTNKINICKAEIAQTLKTLDARSHFNLIAFGDRVQSWKDGVVSASPENVQSAISWLKNRPAAGETNYYDALRTVLELGERPDATPNFRDTPDTITFLTDGMPTRGEITDSKTLLAWYTRLNRYSRVTTHVIAFGDRGLEIELLRALAQQNYGTFVHVPGRK